MRQGKLRLNQIHLLLLHLQVYNRKSNWYDQFAIMETIVPITYSIGGGTFAFEESGLPDG